MQGKKSPLIQAINDLLEIMVQLRNKETGCPWDLKQTWQSLLPYTLEEVYEVADAVDRQDAPALCDELGDLLLQIVFMSQIAQEQGLFNFQDVVHAISQKMLRRHPHVFADTHYASIEEQKQGWEAIKQAERTAKSELNAKPFFADIPLSLTALQRSEKLQKRAAQVGFDWQNWQQVVPKIQEELAEVIEAVEQQQGQARIQEEIGDLLFAVTNLARFLHVNSENSLRLANHKFEKRFLQMQGYLLAQGLALAQCSLEQMEAAWLAVKQLEKAA
jgi:ATP diphosphatase